MSQDALAGVVSAPAPRLLIRKRLDAFGVPGTLGVNLGEGVALSFVSLDFLVELVDLAAGAGLAAIEATRVQKERPAHLLALPLHLIGRHGRYGRGGDQGVHTPIDPRDTRDGAPGGTGCFAGRASARSRTAVRAAGRDHLTQRRGQELRAPT
jgi:hypothetical protein